MVSPLRDEKEHERAFAARIEGWAIGSILADTAWWIDEASTRSLGIRYLSPHIYHHNQTIPEFTHSKKLDQYS